jgi:hypothetical protein
MSGDKAHVRASERTAADEHEPACYPPRRTIHRIPKPARPRTDGRAIDVEIAHLQKLMGDLAMGMRNLRTLRPAPFDLTRRVVEHAAKIRAVEAKLFRLRQGRLL